MVEIHYLDTFDLPELEPYRSLRRRKDMQREHLFVAEGSKVIRRLLDSPYAYGLVSFLMTPEWLEELRLELEMRPEQIQVYVTDKKGIEQIIGHSSYQGVKVFAKVLNPPDLETVLEGSSSPRLFVACDGLANAENMGTVVRNSAAFGADALLIGETSFSPFLTRTIRASMGTVFDLPAVHLDNLVDRLKDLKWKGFQVLGAHPHTDRKTIAQADYSGDVCIVLGSEGHGISEAVQAVCHELVAIPMSGNVDSLNVGSSVAVFLYEVARQRGRM
jgi:tRNA G18 (ribose-2'-O)-methylase SpoU